MKIEPAVKVILVTANCSSYRNLNLCSCERDGGDVMKLQMKNEQTVS